MARCRLSAEGYAGVTAAVQVVASFAPFSSQIEVEVFWLSGRWHLQRTARCRRSSLRSSSCSPRRTNQTSGYVQCMALCGVGCHAGVHLRQRCEPYNTRVCVCVSTCRTSVRARVHGLVYRVLSRRVASCCGWDFRASGWSVGLRRSSRAVVAVVEGPPGEGPRNG